MKIDGREIPYYWQETVLDAATRAGIFIPSLCTDTTFPDSNSCCRLCMVEITEYGRTWIAGACETLSEADMEIRTNTPEIEEARKTVLQLLHAEAPHSEKINKLMELYGVDAGNISQKHKEGEKECILCGNCERACKYYLKGAISRMNRGVNREINTPYGKETEECVGCATCQMVCPINAITVEDKDDKRKIWHNEFNLIRCEDCGQIITTDKNFEDRVYPDAPQLCHLCSEEYRKKHRTSHDISSF